MTVSLYFSLIGGKRRSAVSAAAAYFNFSRLKSSAESSTPRQNSTSRPAPSSTHDWIGPPSLLSNLRPIVYRESQDESELEKRLRNLRQDTEDWNHRFWSTQNLTFSRDKEEFIVSQLKAKGLTLRDEAGRRRTLNSEEMAFFYKSFLDRNRKRHADYNREWYRRNFTITLLMGRVTLSNIWRTISDRHRRTKSSKS
ncbi:cytochrome c oxidase assembly factor 8 [Gouania willdenowi]|uniref:Apoptogenic protein 1, mitochondrial n=1 Tax=Gouania willdenowi TaxID=441366 RepID=A0A8C5HNN7_GOUWI|nr:apoptogenic protein 1, mitochondrial [Gouania willdenowi]